MKRNNWQLLQCSPPSIVSDPFTYNVVLKLFYPDPRVSVRAYCLPIRVISLWNRLPASIVSAENIHIFKKLLKQVGFSYTMFGKA